MSRGIVEKKPESDQVTFTIDPSLRVLVSFSAYSKDFILPAAANKDPQTLEIFKLFALRMHQYYCNYVDKVHEAGARPQPARIKSEAQKQARAYVEEVFGVQAASDALDDVFARRKVKKDKIVPENKEPKEPVYSKPAKRAILEPTPVVESTPEDDTESFVDSDDEFDSPIPEEIPHVSVPDLEDMEDTTPQATLLAGQVADLDDLDLDIDWAALDLGDE